MATTPATTRSTPTISLALAQDTLNQALKSGATDAEVVLYEGEEFSSLVRLGEVETLKESGSRALGLRVFRGQRVASVSTSDLSPDALDRLVSNALDLARITGEDPFAGLPDPAELGIYRPAAGSKDANLATPDDPTGLRLNFEDVHHLPPAERIEIARRCEAAALAFDTRIQNSNGGDFDTATSHKILVNSRGFAGEFRKSYCGFSCAPIAHDPDGRMQRNYWYSAARTTRCLESPEEIGRIAAQRTLRRLGARRAKTQQCPVVFAPEIARSLFGNLFAAVDGDSVFRNASFLAGTLGQQIAGANITLIDDGTTILTDHGERVGGFGTSPFDAEGLPTRRTVLVDRGVLQTYVTNTYTARKLGTRSTASASRGLAGNPGTGAHNFYLAPPTDTLGNSTALSPEGIIAGVPSGLYVTETMGFGINLTTGDYSQGAAGLWIEHGELAHPVEEITIAGNLRDMFQNITAIGNDLIFRSASAAPTIRIDGLTIAGE